MNDKPTPVNPWLADVVAEYRSGRNDAYLRRRYQQYLEDNPRHTWTDFLEYESLELLTARTPLLLLTRREFNFPQHLSDCLSAFEINVLADLLQFTIEELTEILNERGEEVYPVIDLTERYGYTLRSHKGYTYKMPVLSVENKQKELKKDIQFQIDKILKMRGMKACYSFQRLEQRVRDEDYPLKVQLNVVKEFDDFLKRFDGEYPELKEEKKRNSGRISYLSGLIYGPK